MMPAGLPDSVSRDRGAYRIHRATELEGEARCHRRVAGVIRRVRRLLFGVDEKLCDRAVIEATNPGHVGPAAEPECDDLMRATVGETFAFHAHALPAVGAHSSQRQTSRRLPSGHASRARRPQAQ